MPRSKDCVLQYLYLRRPVADFSMTLFAKISNVSTFDGQCQKQSSPII